ncbi:MAG: collagenase-like protease [Marinilabiliales bacterium]|nr:MAG: collagenase-like protease [Marinilabiliales bacterium]
MPVEITAPVGSFESLVSALKNGADSVYFGIGNLNMRSGSAVNFTEDDLQKIVKLCREYNAKAYLALNVVIFDDEIDAVNTILIKAKEAGVDAIIATDISVLNKARKLGHTVHMSTQSNITNHEAIEFFAQWADVVVLSREMTLEKVKNLNELIQKKNICGPSGKIIKTEVFAHGALCMAISGKCYLSLDNMNSSANRGACTQICRRPYKVTDLDGGIELEVDNEYIMSPKDLATLSFLDKLIDSGVSILKIEGRGRPAEYVGTVIRVYKEAVKSVEENSFTEEKVTHWMEEVAKVYNRGFWEGYYLGQSTGEWSKRHGSSATKTKEYIGRITNYFSNIGVAEAKAETGDVYPGEEYLITGPTTGIIEGHFEEIQIDHNAQQKAGKGQLFAFKVNELTRRGDKLYRRVETNRE